MFAVVTSVIDEDHLTVGKIYNILVINNQVQFLCKLFDCERDTLRYFRPSLNPALNNELLLVHNLIDPQPLFPKGSANLFLFVLKHHISF